MNKQIWENNRKALRAKFPVWADIIERKKRKQRNFDVISEQSFMGDTILKVKQKEQVYYLNGKYAPSAVADRWLEQQGKIEEYAPIVIIGISNGIHIRKIMERAPKTANILIYEPSLELFRRELEEVDLAFLFEKDIPVGLIVEGLNQSELKLYFHHFISVDNMAFLKIYMSGNYENIFHDSVDNFVKDLKRFLRDIDVGWQTNIRYTNVNASNTFYNLHYLYEGYNVADLKGILPADVPTIVVSAGPSLNKNIMELKKAQGKACIIATDTAMKPLLNAGIVPNLFVIVDGLKPGLLFEHKDISKVPMVTMTGVSLEPMRLHKGKKFFYYSGSAFEHRILFELSERMKKDRTLPMLPTGGSVATSAYSLGVFMGSRTIILVGQDLALTGNKTHADGTFQEKMDEIDTDNGAYFEVDAIDGGKVLTRGDLKLYLDWFEQVIKEWKGITAVDATEGGACIHGSKVMTLKSAIRKYCQRDYNVKWHIDRVKKLFSGENREIPLNYFANCEKKLEEVRKKANEGLRYYEKLETLVSTSNSSDKELQKTLKRIKKINRYMESDYMAETVKDSLTAVEYALRPMIYQTKETKDAELLDIAQQGKVMLYAIGVASNEIRELAKDSVLKYAKEHPLESCNNKNGNT